MNKHREKWIESVRNPAFIKQHSIEGIKEAMKELYTFSHIKHGDIKKGEGDIVIINLENVECNDVKFEDYIGYCRDIESIKSEGRYTNIYYGGYFFNLVIKSICDTIRE